MSRQSQSQQAIGFAIGGTATAPTYIIKARQFSNELSSIFDQVMATYSSRDNMYDKSLVGYESSSISLTMPLDDKVCPVLLAAAGRTTTTGASAPFTSAINPFNTNLSNVLSIEGFKLTFFFYDATIGLIRQTNKLASEYTLTIEQDQVNLEMTLLGGEQEILTGAAKTTAEAGFTISTTTYGTLFKPGDLVVRYANAVNMTSPTVVNADFGLSITVSNNVQEVPKTLSTAGLVSPVSHLGQFTAGFEATLDVATDDLYTRYLNSTETAWEFAFTRGVNNTITFLFNPTALDVVVGDKVGDSDEPVKQTVTLEKAKNGITHPSLRTTIVGATNLQTLFV